jgi:hypothetical protein
MDLCDNNEVINNSTKKIIIVEDVQGNKGNKGNNTSKRINCEKEKKMRVETKTWGLNEEQLTHKTQLDILLDIHNGTIEKTKYTSLFNSHIKSKICSYRQQDILKKKLDQNNFVEFIDVIDLLIECKLKCCYCSQEVFILYENVRESKQWSLDRINNDIGHNKGNLVIACLECNLKRRRTNKDAFMFTKNMVIIKT